MLGFVLPSFISLNFFVLFVGELTLVTFYSYLFYSFAYSISFKWKVSSSTKRNMRTFYRDIITGSKLFAESISHLMTICHAIVNFLELIS